jgi:hypothetical protein
MQHICVLVAKENPEMRREKGYGLCALDLRAPVRYGSGLGPTRQDMTSLERAHTRKMRSSGKAATLGFHSFTTTTHSSTGMILKFTECLKSASCFDLVGFCNLFRLLR